MTFKTDIKFDESPILRSLERVAIDRGLVTADPITKEASASELYAPTDDLHEDMLNLVAGLRAKGLHKEAEALEDKVNTQKFAETHLYRAIDEDGDDLLDFAHPEGDVEIAPSSSGLGKVWTEQSAKKEFLKVVNKQPTGKHASASLNKAAAEEMGESQMTDAQAEAYVMPSNVYNLALAFVETVLENSAVDDVYVNGSGYNYDEPNRAARDLTNKFPQLQKWLKHKYQGGKDPSSFWTRVEALAMGNLATYIDGDDAEIGNLLKDVLAEKHGPVYKRTLWMPGKSPQATKKPGMVSKDQLNKPIGILASVVRYLEATNPGTEASDRQIGNLKAKTQGWLNILKRTKTPAPYANIQNALGFHKLKDIKALYWWTKKWRGEVEKEVVEIMKAEASDNSLNAALNKLGQPSAAGASGRKTPAKPGAPKPGAPAGKKPSPAGSGMRQGNYAASAIQTEILNLKRLIEKYKGHEKVIGILNIKHDYMWGPATSKAVKMAETIRAKYKVQSPAIAPANTSATVANLKAMIAAINAGKWTMPGAETKQQGAVYDKVPDVLDTSGLMRVDGTVDVTSASFASLAVFHAFLLGNGLMQQEFAQGQEMVYMRPLQDALLWFQKRSAWKAAQKTDQKLRMANLSYRRDVAKVIRQFVTLTKTIFAQYKKLPAWVPVSWLSKEEYAGPGAGAKPGAGSGMKQKGRGRGRGAGGDLNIELIGGEAGTIPASEGPPITRYIDLSDSQWWELDQKMVLDFNIIDRMSGPNFATTYFSDEQGPRKPTLREAARMAGYRPEQIREIGGKTMLYPWAPQQRPTEGLNMNGWVPAESNPYVREQMAVDVASDDPNTRALNFIRDLRSEISRVLKGWMGQQSGWKNRRKLVTLISREASTWQRKLTRMENDIGRANRRLRRQKR